MRTRLFVALASLCLACGSAGTPAKSAEPVSPPEPAAPPAPPPVPINFHLPAMFGDHMVLQRESEDPIWGWDHPGQLVTVTFDNQVLQAKAGADGRWQTMLPPLPAGGPHSITVAGSETRRIEDVFMGEVWLASGQSNMEFELARASDAATVIPAASKPKFRMFTVTKQVAGAPQTDVQGSWQPSAPDTAPRFSAVAYYFGAKLEEVLGVPVGIIHSSWGGTPAEAWTSRAALAARPETKPLADRYAAGASPRADAEYQKKKAEWHDQVYCKDPGNQGLAKRYAELDFDDATWKELEVPGLWQDQGLAINGVLWFRRTFNVKPQDVKSDFELELGAIDDFDDTYVNGQRVGGLNQDVKDAWNTPRKYKIPSALLKAGKNVVAVRAFDWYGGGGFHGAPSEMRVFPAGRVAAAQPLSGKWRYFIEFSVRQPKELLGKEPQPPAGPSNQNSPGVLFDGMIAPLVPYGVRGAIWYQGEANVGRAAEYRVLLPTMIQDWRTRFRSELPFYIVSLANFMARSPVPQESAWAELRDAQAFVASTVPLTGLAVTIDIGEAGDIHPKNKRDVGQRLALAALAKTYGKVLEFSGPMLESAKIESGKIRLTFSHAEGGLKLAAKTGKPAGFAIAGADKKFFWADTRLEGKSAVLSSKDVAAPRFVRYGWADNPEVNLVNSIGLPGGPFEVEAK